jgi:hypothetical protein
MVAINCLQDCLATTTGASSCSLSLQVDTVDLFVHLSCLEVKVVSTQGPLHVPKEH